MFRFGILTSPHLVIICTYLIGFNLNLSDAILNILITLIKCLTNIPSDASYLFFCFCDRVNSRFWGFFVGVLIDGCPS